MVDQGARQAIQERGKSLLPVGLLQVEGDFEQGAVVNIVDSLGELLGRGIVSYSSTELLRIKGQPSSRIQGILGYRDEEEVVHRDNMVLLS